jgi:hypothetical protein
MTDTTQSNTRSWKVFAELINTSWRKGVDAFIATGRYLLEAKAELDRDVFEALEKRHLDFDPSVGRKLMGIAQNRLICAHGHKLPPCWTTIYELSKLDDSVLETGLADGTIHRGMKRKDVAALRSRDDSKNEGEDEVDETEEAMGSGNGSTEEETLEAHWNRAAKEVRTAFLDAIGVSGVLSAMSAEFGRDLRDRVPATKRKSGRPFRKTLNLVANDSARAVRGHHSRQ